ncbi:MAG: hypothetical protein ACRDJV_00655 [Actinomycetota bacterium]
MSSAGQHRDSVTATKARKYLGIYLEDHLAGSMAGLEMAKRAAGSNRDTELGLFLDQKLVAEISEDQQTLQQLMQRLGFAPNQVKQSVAWLGEKLGRLKLNGEITNYSPLSRLVELEALTLGVRGKLSLWEALRAVTDNGEYAGVDLDAMIERATQQHAQLERFRHEVAASIFPRN